MHQGELFPDPRAPEPPRPRRPMAKASVTALRGRAERILCDSCAARVHAEGFHRAPPVRRARYRISWPDGRIERCCGLCKDQALREGGRR